MSGEVGDTDEVKALISQGRVLQDLGNHNAGVPADLGGTREAAFRIVSFRQLFDMLRVHELDHLAVFSFDGIDNNFSWKQGIIVGFRLGHHGGGLDGGLRGGLAEGGWLCGRDGCYALSAQGRFTHKLLLDTNGGLGGIRIEFEDGLYLRRKVTTNFYCIAKVKAVFARTSWSTYARPCIYFVCDSNLHGLVLFLLA